MTQEEKTPKEKAKELVEKFTDLSLFMDLSPHSERFKARMNHAKQNASICVQEIIDERFDFRDKATSLNNEIIKYWQDVKSEIEKL